MDSAVNISVVTDVLYPVFRKYDIRRAILFGSVAKGTATKESDLDICVDSNLKGLRFLGFLEEVKQAVQMDVDLLDVTHIDKGSRVEDEIQKTGVVIYEK